MPGVRCRIECAQWSVVAVGGKDTAVYGGQGRGWRRDSFRAERARTLPAPRTRPVCPHSQPVRARSVALGAIGFPRVDNGHMSTTNDGWDRYPESRGPAAESLSGEMVYGQPSPVRIGEIPSLLPPEQRDKERADAAARAARLAGIEETALAAVREALGKEAATS